jgi:hypothetical protein
MAVTAVASAATSTSLLASGSNRNVIIANSDANALHVLLGTGTASSSNKSFTLAQDEDAILYGYDGPITGIWAGDGSGSAHITTFSRS